jgi:hypothetical protein
VAEGTFAGRSAPQSTIRNWLRDWECQVTSGCRVRRNPHTGVRESVSPIHLTKDATRMKLCPFITMLAVAFVVLLPFLRTANAQPSGEMRTDDLVGRNPFYLLTLATKRSVQIDIKLDDEQIGAIAAFNARLQEQMRRLFRDARASRAGGNKSAGVPTEVITMHAQQTREALLKLLRSEQVTRLKQIYRQQLGPYAFLDDEVLRRLDLGSSQEARISELFAAARRADQQIATDAPEAGRSRVSYVRNKKSELRSRLTAQILAELSENQRTAFDELIGAPISITEGDDLVRSAPAARPEEPAPREPTTPAVRD